MILQIYKIFGCFYFKKSAIFRGTALNPGYKMEKITEIVIKI